MAMFDTHRLPSIHIKVHKTVRGMVDASELTLFLLLACAILAHKRFK